MRERLDWLRVTVFGLLCALVLSLSLLYANSIGHNRELREQIRAERARVDRLIIKGVWAIDTKGLPE